MNLIDKTKTIQGIVGVTPDGAYGPATADAILARLGHNGGPALDAPTSVLTERIMMEILEHEALVLEAYKDSVGVWTWGAGVTDKSGHSVMRYKDQPQPISRCLEVYEWLLRTKYLPTVLAAFAPIQLTEAQLAAALSFHWNTGAIARADWVKSFKAGQIDRAREEMLNWATPREILGRRKLERALFFDGQWSSDDLVTIYTKVSKPSYAPQWASAKQVNISAELKAVMVAASK